MRRSGLIVECDARWDYPLHDSIVRKSVDYGADIIIKDTHYHSALQRSIFSEHRLESDSRLCRGTLARQTAAAGPTAMLHRSRGPAA